MVRLEELKKYDQKNFKVEKVQLLPGGGYKIEWRYNNQKNILMYVLEEENEAKISIVCSTKNKKIIQTLDTIQDLIKEKLKEDNRLKEVTRGYEVHTYKNVYSKRIQSIVGWFQFVMFLIYSPLVIFIIFISMITSNYSYLEIIPYITILGITYIRTMLLERESKNFSGKEKIVSFLLYGGILSLFWYAFLFIVKIFVI